ncbi:hypothetical protein KFK09_025431 [Dendrobium nobile]|uniref:Uncharacterized protein n=1 Tax=Dendrobium nobile TaxID=94219 RepID=A0A8T3AGY2_DENNO|nr:hypothetical protein KFK09_025431 [Dendrobium nobile]
MIFDPAKLKTSHYRSSVQSSFQNCPSINFPFPWFAISSLLPPLIFGSNTRRDLFLSNNCVKIKLIDRFWLSLRED